MQVRSRRPRPLRRRAGVTLLWLSAALAAPLAHAQFKVVGPDGKITYTDRAPVAPAGRVSPLAVAADPGTAGVVLPADLQAVATRYPVVLYVSGSVCSACDSGREMLRQRGIPYIEKQVLSGADGVALERLTGARDVPTLTIGAQTLRAYSVEVWTSYLDAAGYPRTSRLPAGYASAAPTPLTQRQEGLASRGNAPGEPNTAVQPYTPAPVAPPAAPASGIRF
ncbi:MAG: NrdH-redoxin [Burkholderiaceae bacterium]